MTPPGAAGDNRDKRGAGRYGAQGGARPAGPLVKECPPPYQRHSGQVAAVLLYDNGGHSVLWPDRRNDVNKPWFRTEFTAFEVLLGLNVTDFELSLPAAGDAQNFDAKVSVEWEVEDPYLVVSRRVWDVEELLRGALLDGLHRVSRRFRLTEAELVDEAVQNELRTGRLDLGRPLGLRTTIRVIIALSESVRRKVGERDEVDFEVSLDERKLDAQRRREEAERRLFRDRTRALEEVFRRGEEAEIIHFMVKNPEKEWDIRQAVRSEKRERQTDFLNLFNRLIDTGILERHDIGEQTYEVLQYLKESTGGVIDGVTDRRPVEGPPRRAIGERTPGREPEQPSWETDETGDEPGRKPAGRTAGGRKAPGTPADGPWPPPPLAPPPAVHEPTRVESSSERDAYTEWAEQEESDDSYASGPSSRRSRPQPSNMPDSRPSSAFDWGDDE